MGVTNAIKMGTLLLFLIKIWGNGKFLKEEMLKMVEERMGIGGMHTEDRENKDFKTFSRTNKLLKKN